MKRRPSLDPERAAGRPRPRGLVRPADVEPEAVVRVLRVPPELAGMRLDRFVQGQLRATSRTRSQAIVERSAYSLEGARLSKNHRLKAEEQVVLWRPPWDELSPRLELTTLYEDEALVAINKPPLVAVHPTARFHRTTVTALIAEQRPDDQLTLVHRLDRETSGVLLLARTHAADRDVKIQFEERRGVLKRYLAICWNDPHWERATSELPLEPDPDSRFRVRMRVARAGSGLAAATTFEVLERKRRGEQAYALVRCTLHSGRQHQIRVHLAAEGLPIVGDKLYGPDERLFGLGADGALSPSDLAILELERHALHAELLEIDHPVRGGRLRIEAPLYPDLEAFWLGL
jgi:23S rRNA pseudouridine1911/1915/1917 synthase